MLWYIKAILPGQFNFPSAYLVGIGVSVGDDVMVGIFVGVKVSVWVGVKVALGVDEGNGVDVSVAATVFWEQAVRNAKIAHKKITFFIIPP
jgi:hypothetical protein